MQPPPAKRFECEGCGESFGSFKAAALHAWTPNECKGEHKPEREFIEEIVSCLGSTGSQTN
jgi:hypothetical protein